MKKTVNILLMMLLFSVAANAQVHTKYIDEVVVTGQVALKDGIAVERVN